MQAIVFKKYLSLIFIIPLCFLFTACPDTDCNDIDSIANVPDLIKIEPLQTNYNQGDEIIFKVSLLADTPYFSTPNINIFEITQDNKALLLLSSDELFLDNELTFIKGEQENIANFFHLIYNPTNETYELELKIKLNKTGHYSFLTVVDNIEIIGENCNRFRIDTNIQGKNSENKIEFTVE